MAKKPTAKNLKSTPKKAAKSRSSDANSGGVGGGGPKFVTNPKSTPKKAAKRGVATKGDDPSKIAKRVSQPKARGGGGLVADGPRFRSSDANSGGVGGGGPRF